MSRLTAAAAILALAARPHGRTSRRPKNRQRRRPPNTGRRPAAPPRPETPAAETPAAETPAAPEAVEKAQRHRPNHRPKSPTPPTRRSKPPTPPSSPKPPPTPTSGGMGMGTIIGVIAFLAVAAGAGYCLMNRKA